MQKRIIFINFVIMKAKRKDIEFYREMMEYFQAESASKSAREAALLEEIKALREEMASMALAHKEDKEAIVKQHEQTILMLEKTHKETVEAMEKSHREEMDKLRASFEKKFEHMAEINADFSVQLRDALASGKLARARKYGRSSEQRDLLNNRKEITRKNEEDDSDGTPPAATPSPSVSTVSDGKDSRQSPETKKAGGRRRRQSAPEGKMHFDAVIEHPMEEFMELPEGARLIPGTMTFELLRYIPARLECHVYPYQRYILAREEDKDLFGETLPAEIRRMRPVDGCPLSAEILAFIFTQKYAYHQPQKRIRIMLKDMGVHIPKKTFNRYMMKGAAALKSMLGEIYRKECRRGNYFMIDETVMTVGVEDEELGRRYLNRYMWEFYNRTAGLVEYVYEEGSRGQKVLKAFFGEGTGLVNTVISCDAYNAYKLFDREEYPGVTVVGCWSHARRNFVDALESCRPQCEEMLGMIGRLFEIEAECREAGYDENQRLRYRRKRTGPLLKTIRATVERMWNDSGLMAVGLLKKAVGYLRNQWDHLSNIIKTGVAEISNNLSEQRIRPLKLSLKNCLNIGSERAASLHAFIYSLAESCRLNSVNIQDYFTCLFSKARSQLSPDDLRGLLPNHYLLKC